MFYYIGIFMGSISSNINSNSTFAGPAKIKSIDSLTNHNVVPLNVNEDSSVVLDITESIEEHKSLSLAYQLMKAIAREAGEKLVARKTLNSAEVNHTDALAPSTQGTTSGDNQVQITFAHELSQFSTFDQTNVEWRTGSSGQVNNTQFSTVIQPQLSLNVNLENDDIERADPLVLNLDNSKFAFKTDQSFLFDLDVDGNLDQIAPLANGNSFLALDKNNNGKVDNGSELFGDSGGAVDGFADLSGYDLNSDNQINAQDNIFRNLLLVNFNADGEQNIRSISTEEIASISLNVKPNIQLFQNNNLLIAESNFKRNDGSLGRIGDFLLSIS